MPAIPYRFYCSWRMFVTDHMRSLNTIDPKRCILISPRFARLTHGDGFMPYFQIRHELRRFIWETFYDRKVPDRAIMRHRCLQQCGMDSRGLCVNPHHITIGTRDDNRLDARVEEKLREGSGYWKPEEYSPLPDLSELPQHQVILMPFRYEPDMLQLWAGNTEALDASTKQAHMYCNYLSNHVKVPMPEWDREALSLCMTILNDMKSGRNPQRTIEAYESHRSRMPREAQQQCMRHKQLYQQQLEAQKAEQNYKRALKLAALAEKAREELAAAGLTDGDSDDAPDSDSEGGYDMKED